MLGPFRLSHQVSLVLVTSSLTYWFLTTPFRIIPVPDTGSSLFYDYNYDYDGRTLYNTINTIQLQRFKLLLLFKMYGYMHIFHLNSYYFNVFHLNTIYIHIYLASL